MRSGPPTHLLDGPTACARAVRAPDEDGGVVARRPSAPRPGGPRSARRAVSGSMPSSGSLRARRRTRDARSSPRRRPQQERRSSRAPGSATAAGAGDGREADGCHLRLFLLGRLRPAAAALTTLGRRRPPAALAAGRAEPRRPGTGATRSDGDRPGPPRAAARPPAAATSRAGRACGAGRRSAGRSCAPRRRCGAPTPG